MIADGLAYFRQLATRRARKLHLQMDSQIGPAGTTAHAAADAADDSAHIMTGNDVRQRDSGGAIRCAGGSVQTREGTFPLTQDEVRMCRGPFPLMSTMLRVSCLLVTEVCIVCQVAFIGYTCFEHVFAKKRKRCVYANCVAPCCQRHLVALAPGVCSALCQSTVRMLQLQLTIVSKRHIRACVRHCWSSTAMADFVRTMKF